MGNKLRQIVALLAGPSMHRAVVLTTLVVLLLAVAGVSAAQESGIFLGGPNTDVTPGTTTPGRSEDTSEPTVLTEPTVGETEESTVVAPVEEETTPDTNSVGEPGTSGRGLGKPEDAGKPPNIGKVREEAGHTGTGEPAQRGNDADDGRGEGRQKVTLCHKRKTITVGQPALDAHLNHGDRQGGCPDRAETAPSGDTMGSEAAKDAEIGSSGGQEKVILCHKGKKTLTVGAPAQAAHERHGDTLGACP